ncbi:hypothetical protein B0T16DRAFT_456604 [Cercophora newfieldiana]|uniref:Uncharacterized protein n=1 Tax=Cercophora newfieldiana TaxID=92897 RepID=A0AA39YAR5_9PEZI|nr:hypothetical protein B0T16DRAFT_456604 [Cercophora newfieldiana]
MESRETPRSSRRPGSMWFNDFILYSFLVLWSAYLIGGVWQVRGQLRLAFGKRTEDTVFASLLTVALVTALSVFVYKWCRLVVNLDVSASETRLRSQIMLCGRQVAAMPHGRWFTRLSCGVVALINILLFCIGIWWMSGLYFAHFPGDVSPMQELAMANTWMLIVTYLALMVLTIFNAGFHYAWDQSRGEENDGEFDASRGATQPPGKPPVGINGWLRLWDLSIYFP